MRLPFLLIKNKLTAAKRLWLLTACLTLSLASFSQNLGRPNIDGPAGLQVNSYTGSLFYQRTDMFIPARGLPLQITFSYNSASRKGDYGYGFGWTINYNEFYTESDGLVTFQRADGRIDNFGTLNTHVLPELNTYYLSQPVGNFDKVTKSGTTYTITQKDGTQYFFENPSNKKLTRIQDRNGNQTILGYSGNNLTSVSDGFGRSINIGWNGSHISSLNCSATSPAHTVTYNVDGQGNLLAASDAKSQQTGYTYGADRVMTSVTDPDQNTVKVLYNANNAVKEIISCLADKQITYDSANNKVYVVDKTAGRSLLTTYNFETPQQPFLDLKIVSYVPPRLVSRVGNCCGYSTKFGYDIFNNITGITDANGNTTVYGYDASGNLLSETDPLGKTITYKYEPIFNQVTSITDKRGNKTVFKYDTKGNLLEKDMPLGITNTYTYYDNGDRKTFTDGRGTTISYAYDAYGYLNSVTDSAGVTKYLYDAWGNLTSQTDKNNYTTTYYYDLVNQLVQKQDAKNNLTKYTYDANGNITLLTDARNNTTIYGYDAYNNLIFSQDALGYSSTMVFDGMGKMLSKTDRNGHTIKFDYDNENRLIAQTNAAGEKTQYAYDPAGNRVSMDYPNGNTVYMKYDMLNRAVQISDKLGIISSFTYDGNSNKLSATNALGNTTTYQYDALNRMVSEADPTGNAYTYLYDANNNLVRKTDRNGNPTAYVYNQLNWLTTTVDALNYTTKYTYDPLGNQASVTDANNNKTGYTYDELNRKTQETFADGTTRKYGYDQVSNLISRTDNKGIQTNYVFDKDNRLHLRQYPTAVDTFTYDAEGKMLTAYNQNARIDFTYDVVDRVASEKLNGKQTSYAYNIPGRTKTITYPGGRTITRTMDVRSQLIGINEGATNIANFTYNAAGQNMVRNFGNGTSNSFSYNSKGLIASYDHNGTSKINDQALDITYKYDKEDNPLYASHTSQVSLTENYSNDALNRLTGFTKGGNILQQSFSYDGVGNRITADSNSVATSYQVNSMNAYTSIVDSGKTINPVYDGNGNETNDGRNIYVYDYENRIITVNNGTTAKYSYDALGRRIQKKTATNTVNYFFDGLQVVEEESGNDSTLANYVWGTWVDDIVSMKRSGDTYYYNTSIVGSVNSITDTSGAVVERYEYDAFGKFLVYNGSNALNTSSFIGNVYAFTGREYDVETGLYNYRARFYDDLNGRFLERDATGYSDGIALYSYAHNDPTRAFDPLGTQSLFCDILNKLGLTNYYNYLNQVDYSKLGQEGFNKIVNFLSKDAFNFLIGDLANTIAATGLWIDGRKDLAQQIVPGFGWQDIAVQTIFNLPIGEFFKGGELALKEARAIEQETVSVFHGSINNSSDILKNGLEIRESATYVSTDYEAASNAIGPNRFDIANGIAKDPGIIESRIPVSEFNELMSPAERSYSGFGGNLNTSEILLRSREQIDLFNKYIVK